MSAKAPTLRPMALVNIAFCHGQMGSGQLAKAYYERALQEFPNSGIATAALRMLIAMGQDNPSQD